MGRPSAAEKAQKELEAAKLKETSGEIVTGGDSGDAKALSDAITQGSLENGTGGDSGAVLGGDLEDKTGLQESTSKEPAKMAVAVALRDIPGGIVKHGQIVKAPETLIKQWDDRGWVDTHENALKAAEIRYEKSVLVNPHGNHAPLMLELDDQGEIVVQILED